MEAVTHLEKVITGEASAVTHLERVITEETAAVTYTEKVITGTVPPITHLQKVIAGEASPVTHLEHVWAGKQPTPEPTEHEYTGAVPTTIYADGTPLLDYLISGNMEQSGTPTPTTPIQPQETGDLETEGAKAGQYKIPISSASTTTPVYLGEVQTTRKVKKLVFDGTENWRLLSLSWATNVERFYLVVSKNCISPGSIISSHFPTLTNNSDTEHTRCGGNPMNEVYIYISRTVATNAAALKSYLAQQYASGTPVTVWYVLATETTGIVNEPLRKIGDYADTLSMEQAGVSIPTDNGSTTVDVETTLKPSEVYIKYKG